MSRKVIVDLTALRTASRVRGIGRYVGDLALALFRANQEEREGLRLRYLQDVSWSGAVSVTDDAEEAVRGLMDPTRSEWSQGKRHRRLSLGYGRMLAKEAPRLVHLPEPRFVPKVVKGVSRLVTCHDLIPLIYQDEYLPQPGRRKREWERSRRRYASADHVLSISRATAEDLKRLFDIPEERLTVVYHGLAPASSRKADDDACGRLLTELGLPSTFFLFVGDADYRKNSDGMCKALGMLERDVPLVWVGRLAQDRRAQVKRLALEAGARIVFAGFVEDAILASLYRSATATLFVSRYEGFGYPVIEAMREGCAVITSTTSSLPETAGDAAVMVDPEDVPAIAEGMKRVLEDAELRTQLQKAGLEQAAKFSFDRQARETLALYHRLVSDGSA